MGADRFKSYLFHYTYYIIFFTNFQISSPIGSLAKYFILCYNIKKTQNFPQVSPYHIVIKNFSRREKAKFHQTLGNLPINIRQIHYQHASRETFSMD